MMDLSGGLVADDEVRRARADAQWSQQKQPLRDGGCVFCEGGIVV